MNRCTIFKKHYALRFFSLLSTRFSHYETLGVKSSATQDEIKLAYKEKSMKLHPDVNQSDPKTHDEFIKLNEAYKTLSNDELRSNYDDHLDGNTFTVGYETLEMKYNRLHQNFEKHFGVKVDKEEFIRQLTIQDQAQEKPRDKVLLPDLTKLCYIFGSITVVFMGLIALTEYRAAHVEPDYSHLSGDKKRFNKSLDKQEREEMNVMFAKARYEKNKEEYLRHVRSQNIGQNSTK